MYQHTPDAQWSVLEALEARVAGARLELSEQERTAVAQAAPGVLLDEAAVLASLRDPTQAAATVLEMRARIRRGSQRLMRAVSESTRLHADGDVVGAERMLREVMLDSGELPFYREVAEAQLQSLTDE